MDIADRIKDLSSQYFNQIVEIRRHLHSFPELSFEEVKTSAFICSKLEESGIPYKTGFKSGYGIVAWIDGKAPGRVIALRADMDALPVKELNDVTYCSKEEGKMHACGHDAHMACLLGAAMILSELRDEFTGRIKFVFQPAEERIPGGAKLMLEENVLAPDEPEIMIAQHVFPDLESGLCGFREGMYMASSDEIFITIKGRGGHAALPDKLIDPVTVSAHVIVALQNITSRFAPPAIPTVLSFGKITANGAVNVIPDQVNMEGTFRTMNEDWRMRAHELIAQICNNTASSFGASAEIEIRRGYPVLYNNPAATSKARNLAEKFLGKTNVIELDVRMTAEDFAYFALKYPSFMYRLGTAEAGKPSFSLHNSRFNVDENSLRTGMGLLAWLAYGFLKNES